MLNNQALELLLAEIDLLKSEIIMRSNYLDEQLQRQLAIEYCYESNRLEGGLLNLRETQMVFNIGLSGKPMSENLAMLNHFKAVEFIREQATEQALLTDELIKQLHAILSRAIPREHVGSYRNQSCLVMGTDYPAPLPSELADKIASELLWLRLEGPFLHPVIFAAETHLRIQALQPFNQTNGLCARLAMNLVLLSESYAIVNIPGDNETRDAYYQTLAATLLTGNKGPWFEFIARQAMNDGKALLDRLKQTAIEP